MKEKAARIYSYAYFFYPLSFCGIKHFSSKIVYKLTQLSFNPRPTKGGGYPWRFVSGRTKTQKKVTPGI